MAATPLLMLEIVAAHDDLRNELDELRLVFGRISAKRLPPCMPVKFVCAILHGSRQPWVPPHGRGDTASGVYVDQYK